MAKGIPVTECRKCPFKKEINPYSTDGFDMMVDWVCTKLRSPDGPTKIQGAVEWHEESKIGQPEWCPLSEIKE